MLKFFVAGATGFFLTCTAAVASCEVSEPTMKACVAGTLEAENIVIEDHVADPGGGKRRDAINSCGFDCSRNLSAFQAKWGSVLQMNKVPDKVMTND